MFRPLKPKAMISAPMKVPRTWNSPSRSVAEPEEDGGEGGEQIGVGGAGGAAAEARGEQDAGQRRAHAGDDEAEDLDAVDIDAGEARRGRIAADRLDLLADRRALDQHPEAAEHERHDDDLVGDAEQPAAERQLQEGFRHAGDDRNAGGIGEGQADDDGADAERRDHRVHPELGDDQAVDEADQRAEREHDQDGERDRQLVLDDRGR